MSSPHITISILGMHRSGTSCLAGALQTAGLFAGTIGTWHTDNLQGNRENQAIMDLNNSLLQANQASWDNPPATLTYSPQYQQQRDQLITQLNAQAPAWMFKDPRTLLTLTFWQEGLKNSNNTLQFVGTFRHPSKVALSLYQRSQMPLREGIELWLHYNRILLDTFQQSPFPLLCFDLPRTEYLNQLTTAIESLNANLQPEHQLSVSAAQSFYATPLIHQQ